MSPGLNEERVLILASTGKDGQLASDVLERAGVRSVVCATLDDVLTMLREGAGALLLAHEALLPLGVAALLQALEAQPAWSDIPIMLLTAPAEAYHTSRRLIEQLRPTFNLTLLERPLQKLTLVSAMQAALRSRRRQYQVRDLLKKLEDSRMELHDKIVDLEKFEQVVVGRELRMIELERENAELKRALQKGARAEGNGHQAPPRHATYSEPGSGAR